MADLVLEPSSSNKEGLLVAAAVMRSWWTGKHRGNVLDYTRGLLAPWRQMEKKGMEESYCRVCA